MSTILDALRKVERERDPASEAALDAPTMSSEPRRRRPLPIGAILVCALLGFGGGAVLSWWMPAGQSGVPFAALPEPPPAPDIAVPRPPLRAKPAAAPVPVQDQVAVAPPPAAPAPTAPAVEAAPGVAPPAVAHEKAPTETASGAPSKTASTESLPAVAANDRAESALEPSPFKPSREVADPPVNVATKSMPSQPARAPELREPPGLAAIAPEIPTEPEVLEADDATIEPEPQPDASPESLVDTGRSPPGAPKVALSFLQWSADPARRFAFISVDGAPTQRVREGEVTAGLTVAAITPTGVQFKRDGTNFVIRPRH